MANPTTNEKWYFTKEQLENTPSRKCGYDSHKELSYRQQAANFIQDMGQRLKVSQLCINTAIVYMHRFYVFHSFTHFPWHQMASAALFLAAKVEEQPRKLEYVIRVANMCKNNKDQPIDINSDKYIAQTQDLVFNENVLLQTLGFDVAIDHPHTHVVRCCHLVRASKDLAQTSYFMASNSLHLTTMCIQYKPTVVACFCILVACKWSNWEIPLSNERKEWFSYVDPTVTAELLQQLTEEFLVIFEACPSRLKEKIMAIAENVTHTPSMHINSPFDTDPKKIIKEPGKEQHPHRSGLETDPHKHRSSRPHEVPSTSQQQRDRNRDRIAAHQQQKPPMPGQPKIPHGHHRPPVDPKLKQHPRPPSGYQPSNRVEPRDILRDATISPFGIANKEHRDQTREHKDANAQHKEQSREHKEQSREHKEQVREHKEQSREHKEQSREHKEQSREHKEQSREHKEQSREHKEQVREHKEQSREHKEQSREHKEQSREHKREFAKTADMNSYSESRMSYAADKQRVDPNRPRMDPLKGLPGKHDAAMRRHDESKHKHDADNAKKQQPSAAEKPASYPNKPPPTSQKTKSPFGADPAKSVPKPSAGQAKPYHHNGGSYSDKIKMEMKTELKEEIPTPAVIKRPSLFSPEKTPPPPPEKPITAKTEMETSLPPCILSPLTSPVESSRRSRNLSSSSEPELRPVMKKIDQVEGFENLMRDTTIGINRVAQQQVPDVITPLVDLQTETVGHGVNEVPDVIPLGETDDAVARPPVVVANGLETNPAVISNWLKEAATATHLPAVKLSSASADDKSSGHHHKSKKKNKEKHKHKDKNRDEREKKKKHKEKDREKHRSKETHDAAAVEPAQEHIKIKIQKDKIVTEAAPAAPGLKIKIPKNKINSESISELSQNAAPFPSVGIKLKIPKEKLSYCPNLDGGSKKRDRDRSTPPDGGPPAKLSKPNKDHKTNGRHSSSKVEQLGEGETSMHKLAESKYTHKSSTS